MQKSSSKRAPWVALLLGLGLAAGTVWWLSRAPGHKAVAPSAELDEPPAASPASLSEPSVGPAAIAPPAVGKDGQPGVLFAQLGWGSGPHALGRERPEEANPEAPMSFLATAEGAIVLDQLNGRIVHLDKNGKFVREDKLHVRAAQDIAQGPHGEVLAMDRLVSREVEILDKSGHSVGTLPLEGKGIDNGGGTTGLFVRGDKVYAESAHSVLVELGSVTGTPSTERAQLSGRPSRDGQMLLSAGRSDADPTRVWVNQFEVSRKTMAWAREVAFGAPVRQLLFLDTDARGTVYLAMELARDDDHVTTQLACLSAKDGQLLGRVGLPTNTMPEETFRDFSVRDDGTVLYVHRTEDGSRYLAYHCP